MNNYAEKPHAVQRDMVNQLKGRIQGDDAHDTLRVVLDYFGDRIALASSFSVEDQTITDVLCRLEKPVQLFTIDTGRLPEETYQLIETTRLRYKIDIEILFPDNCYVEPMVRSHGPNLFYNSIEYRKQCCHVRKVEPLKKKLATLDAWICGLRKDQSVTRADVAPIDWDDTYGLVKVCPLANWSEEDVWRYIHENDVPYNELHDKGYPSIGCEPCTRPVKQGDDIRSGRWWWEQPEHKECGLHKRPL